MTADPALSASSTGAGRSALLALLVLLGVIWGLHIAITKALGAADIVEGMGLLTIYVGATFAGLAIAMLIWSRPYRPSWSVLRFFTLSSTLGYTGPILVELVVAPRIDAGVFALIAGATPVATVAIAVAVGRDRLSATLALALAAGAASALVLIGPDASAVAPAGLVALALLVPLFYGADNVYIEAAWPERLDSFQVAAGEGLVALVYCAVISLALGCGPVEMARIAVDGGWLLVALIASSLVCVWLYFHLLHHAGGVFVSFASYIAIAAGVAAGVLLFGERPGLPLAAASALLALALWLLRRDRRRAAALAVASAE